MLVTVLLLAAGTVRRVGGEVPKQYLEVAGAPILVHTLHSLAREPRITAIQPVISGDDDRFSVITANLNLPFTILPPVVGGAERANSMACGLRALAADVEWVAVHDAARPLSSPTLLAHLFDTARLHGAAVPALPVVDTIKQVDTSGRVVKTLIRHELRAVQTPQVARRRWFDEAVTLNSGHLASFTDDMQLLEAAGFPVHVSPGEVSNRKITTPEDLLWLANELQKSDELRISNSEFRWLTELRAKGEQR